MTAPSIQEYRYTAGDRLEARNDYSYSAFGGGAFLRAWWDDRNRALGDLGSPAPHAPPSSGGSEPAPGGFVTGELLEWIFGRLGGAEDAVPPGVRPWLELLVQRFEVTKRLHHAYGENHRAVDRERYREYALYVRFAEVLLQACRTTGLLAYLSTLLKCLDTLCSCRDSLPPELRPRLARVIGGERELVERLAQRLEVSCYR